MLPASYLIHFSEHPKIKDTWQVHTITILTMQSSPYSSYFLPLNNKYRHFLPLNNKRRYFLANSSK